MFSRYTPFLILLIFCEVGWLILTKFSLSFHFMACALSAFSESVLSILDHKGILALDL